MQTTRHQAPSQIRGTTPAEPGHRGKVTRWETVPAGNGYTALRRVVARPGANSAVLHHKILGGGAVVRKVERVQETPDPDDPRRTRREIVTVEDVLLRLTPNIAGFPRRAPNRSPRSPA
jgi:hypothetical protein